MKPASTFAVLVAIVLIAAGPVFCQSTSTADTLTNLPGCWGVLQTKQLSMTFNSAGILGLANWTGGPCGHGCEVNGGPCSSFESPPGSGHQYLFAGALWIGGVVGNDTIVSTSYGGWHAEYEFSPIAASENSIGGLSRI